MVNRHFGKAADVWKHLLLATVIEGIGPRAYAETHAGSATNVMDDAPERFYGVRTFLDAVATGSRLSHSGYSRLARAYADGEPSVYPGSPLVALELLDRDADILMCDIDPDSAADIRAQAQRLGHQRCRVAERDGMTAVAEWLPTAAHPVLVHVDPFDPHARTDGGLSALELAAEATARGAAVAYWYGYDQPDERAWAYSELTRLTDVPLVCLDMGVRDINGTGTAGHLGAATTAGTGFGHVLANVPESVVTRVLDLGTELTQLYAGRPLPDGTPANWHLTVDRRP